jgi:hypothetical protein
MRKQLLLIAFLAACGHAQMPQPVTPTAKVVPAPGLAATDVDRMLSAEWQKANVTPAAKIDDAQFLRRVYVDMLGTLPSPDDVRKFTADPSPDKRAAMVDKVLADPQWTVHWADFWDDELMGNKRGGNVDRGAFRAWLRGRLSKNTPWNEIVNSLVTASGLQSAGGARNPFATKDEEAGVNGATNYLLHFDNPNDAAGSVSKVFLGVQIQCAQCHDHKTEKWKQDDFRKFASCFTRVRIDVLDKGNQMGVKRVDLEDAQRPYPPFARNPDSAPVASAKPTALDGTDLTKDPSARKALATWMTSKDNPWFAKEMVNRMWGHFLGRGFVNPVDDLRPGNPPEAGELFDALAKDFAEHGFDQKRLMRTIVLTQAYQLASGQGEPQLWSKFRVSPMGPGELVGALLAATDVDDLAIRATRADPEEVRQKLLAAYGFVFDVDEQFDKPSYEGTITQALVMLNGRVTAAGSSAIPGTTLVAMMRTGANDEQILDELYLRTLSRKPTNEEIGKAIQYIADAKVKPTPARVTIPPPPRIGRNGQATPGPKKNDPAQRMLDQRPMDARTAALEDIFWTLLNSSEFFFNH